jgi:serine/threonine protein kinase
MSRHRSKKFHKAHPAKHRGRGPFDCGPARGEAVGPATDVWGIGAVLYEAASGEVPLHSRA